VGAFVLCGFGSPRWLADEEPARDRVVSRWERWRRPAFGWQLAAVTAGLLVATAAGAATGHLRRRPSEIRPYFTNGVTVPTIGASDGRDEAVAGGAVPAKTLQGGAAWVVSATARGVRVRAAGASGRTIDITRAVLALPQGVRPGSLTFAVGRWRTAPAALFATWASQRTAAIRVVSLGTTPRLLARHDLRLPATDRRLASPAEWSGPEPDLAVLDVPSARSRAGLLSVYAGETSFRKRLASEWIAVPTAGMRWQFALARIRSRARPDAVFLRRGRDTRHPVLSVLWSAYSYRKPILDEALSARRPVDSSLRFAVTRVGGLPTLYVVTGDSKARVLTTFPLQLRCQKTAPYHCAA
jgi:hypothetical protein